MYFRLKTFLSMIGTFQTKLYLVALRQFGDKIAKAYYYYYIDMIVFNIKKIFNMR